MGFLSSLIGGGIQGIIGGANTLIKTIWGSQEERDQQTAADQVATENAYASEYNAPEKVFLFDRLVDGANRLVRPIFTYGTIALFIWAAMNPARFAITMKSMTIVPEMLWYILLAIVAFWFGGRILEKAPTKITPPSNQQVMSVIQDQEALQAASYTEDKYQAELKDNSKPLSNQAILEWNRRRSQGTS